MGIDLADALIAYYNPVVRIIQHESIRDGCDCCGECLAFLFTFGSQPVPLREAVAKHRQGPRHGTNLVMAGSGNGYRNVPGVETVDRHHQSPERNRDRAQDDKRKENPCNHCRQHDALREPGRSGYIRNCLIAGSGCLASQFGYNRGEQLIDSNAVLSCLGQQRIADYSAISSILLNGVSREFYRRVPFRENEQANGKVSQPIAQLAERHARTICRLDDVYQIGHFCHRCRIVG